MIIIVPAYGRDYKSKKALVADLNAGKDFIIVGSTYLEAERDPSTSRRPLRDTYANLQDFNEMEVEAVRARYHGMRKVTIIKIVDGRAIDR